MAYQTTINVPYDIASRVSGKYIEIENEITKAVQRYRETLYNLSEAHSVQIKYSKQNEQFTISGLKTNVDKTYTKLKEIVKEKKDEHLAYKERKRQQKLDHQEYLLRKKRRELYKQNTKNQSSEQQKKVGDKREKVIIDKKNPFHMLNVEDSDDDYFERVELKKDYEKKKRTCTKEINSLTAKLNTMNHKFKSMPTQESLDNSELSDEDINKYINERQELQKTFDETKLEIQNLQHQNEMTFEQYEDKLNGIEPEESFNDLTNEESENEEDVHFEIEVEEKSNQPVSDEVREAEMDNYITHNSIPRGRSSYQMRHYKNNEDNTVKSGSWTYVSNGGKARTTPVDKKRHFKQGPHHHNRNPNKFDKHDLYDELENANDDRRIPTDNFKDLLGEITGENYLSEFPPLVSN
jgi:hypothetical protein